MTGVQTCALPIYFHELKSWPGVIRFETNEFESVKRGIMLIEYQKQLCDPIPLRIGNVITDSASDDLRLVSVLVFQSDEHGTSDNLEIQP